MKNIILPKSDSKDISISAINEDTKGVIICYKDSNPVGSINYYSDTSEWYFNKSLNIWCNDTGEDTLHNLIMELLEANVCDSFKLIEFNYDKQKRNS